MQWEAQKNKKTFFNQKGQLKWVNLLDENDNSQTNKQNAFKKLLAVSSNLIRSIAFSSKKSLLSNKSNNYPISQKNLRQIQVPANQSRKFDFQFLRGLQNIQISDLVEKQTDEDSNKIISKKFLNFLQSAEQYCLDQEQIANNRQIIIDQGTKDEIHVNQIVEEDKKFESPQQIRSEQEQATIKFQMSKAKNLRQRSRSKEIRRVRFADQMPPTKKQIFQNILSKLTKHKHKKKEFVWVREGVLKKSSIQNYQQKRQSNTNGQQREEGLFSKIQDQAQQSIEEEFNLKAQKAIQSSEQQKLL